MYILNYFVNKCEEWETSAVVKFTCAGGGSGFKIVLLFIIFRCNCLLIMTCFLFLLGMNTIFGFIGTEMEELTVVLHQYKCSSKVGHLEGGGIKEQMNWAEALVAALEVENNKEMGMNGAVLKEKLQHFAIIFFTNLMKC